MSVWLQHLFSSFLVVDIKETVLSSHLYLTELSKNEHEQARPTKVMPDGWPKASRSVAAVPVKASFQELNNVLVTLRPGQIRTFLAKLQPFTGPSRAAAKGGRACRTAQFPIPGNCGAVPPSSGAFESLPWVVTVQVEALADVHDPEDLLPCPSVPHPQGVVSGNSRSFKAPPTPDFFFGHLARVAVTHKLTSTCAGVAVTGRHILTAAHCLFAPRYKPTYTVLNRSHTTGMHKKESAGLPVATAVFHPGCSFHGTSRAVNDVAVLV
ncbi:unnamed protein product, partial [Ixodes pacificus]